MLAPSVIIPFDGNHADIPSDFVRETTLDGKYPKGSANGVNPNQTGGNATHAHASPTHTHTMAAHTHTYQTNEMAMGSGTGGYPGPSVPYMLAGNHYHTGTSGAASGGSITYAVTYGAVSNDPAYYTVIFIKASSYTTIPNNAMVLKEGISRAGLAFHSDSAGKFLKGAGTGANAGDTGGSTTNVHSIAHQHASVNHTHAQATSSASLSKYDVNATRPGTQGYDAHEHDFGLASSAQAIANYTGSLTTAETVQPAYKTLNAFKNESGNNTMPLVGDIGLWLGTLANIPIGWNLCDGTNNTPDMRSKFFKVNSTATTSSTGGSNTHTHAAQSHSHTLSGSHVHTLTNATHYSTASIIMANTNGGGSEYDLTGAHTLASIASRTPAYAAANTTANSSSNEPEYRTVAYIQFVFPPVLPNPILNMMIDTIANSN